MQRGQSLQHEHQKRTRPARGIEHREGAKAVAQPCFGVCIQQVATKRALHVVRLQPVTAERHHQRLLRHVRHHGVRRVECARDAPLA